MTYDEAITKWAEKKTQHSEPNAVKVTLELEERSGGYCSTCAYTEEVVHLRWFNKDNEVLYAETLHSEDFGDMLREIVEIAGMDD